MERVKKCRYPERKICNIYAEMQQICNAICISEVYVRQKRLESQGSTQEYRSLYSLTHWETIIQYKLRHRRPAYIAVADE